MPGKNGPARSGFFGQKISGPPPAAHDPPDSRLRPRSCGSPQVGRDVVVVLHNLGFRPSLAFMEKRWGHRVGPGMKEPQLESL